MWRTKTARQSRSATRGTPCWWLGWLAPAVVMEPSILNPTAFVRRLKAFQSFRDALPLLKYILPTPFVSGKDGHERFDYIMTRLMNQTNRAHRISARASQCLQRLLNSAWSVAVIGEFFGEEGSSPQPRNASRIASITAL